MYEEWLKGILRFGFPRSMPGRQESATIVYSVTPKRSHGPVVHSVTPRRSRGNARKPEHEPSPPSTQSSTRSSTSPSSSNDSQSKVENSHQRPRRNRKKRQETLGDALEVDNVNGDDSPATEQGDDLSTLRCESATTEDVAARFRQRSEGYPGLSLGSAFSSNTMMRFSVIRNELHNVMSVQLRRASADVASLTERVDSFQTHLESRGEELLAATKAVKETLEELKKEAQYDAFEDKIVSMEDIQRLMIEHGYSATCLEDVLTRCSPNGDATVSDIISDLPSDKLA